MCICSECVHSSMKNKRSNSEKHMLNSVHRLGLLCKIMQHLVSSKSVCRTRQVKHTNINMWKLSIETAVKNEIFFNIHISVLLVFFFMFVDMQRIKCTIYLLCKRHASNESEIGNFFNGKFDFFFSSTMNILHSMTCVRMCKILFLFPHFVL